MSFPITMYKTPSCPNCVKLVNLLSNKGINIPSTNIFDVSEDREALAFVRGMGYQQVPVIVYTNPLTNDGPRSFSGLDQREINDLVRQYKSWQDSLSGSAFDDVDMDLFAAA